MSNLPDLGIILFTYDRPETAERTIRAVLEKVSYSGNIRFHIADDGSSEDYRQNLFRFAGGFENVHAMSMTNAGRQGYGHSYNLATQLIHPLCDVVLPLEDDWELMKPLHLDPLVDVLLNNPWGVGCLRLGRIGYTQKLYAEFVWKEHVGHFLVLDPDSPEPHVFAGGPRLELASWARTVGPWPTGLTAGQTEFSVAHRREAREGVAWPVDLIKPSGDFFVHIGTRKVGDAPLGVLV